MTHLFEKKKINDYGKMGGINPESSIKEVSSPIPESFLEFDLVFDAFSIASGARNIEFLFNSLRKQFLIIFILCTLSVTIEKYNYTNTRCDELEFEQSAGSTL